MIKNSRGSAVGFTLFLPAMGVAFLFLTITSPVLVAKSEASLQAQGRYTGTQSCRPCHEKFYKLWAPSHHGKAMQAYDDRFAVQYLTPPTTDITVASNKYQAFIGNGQGWVEEKGPTKTTKLPIKFCSWGLQLGSGHGGLQLGSGHAKNLTLRIKWPKTVSKTALIDQFSP